MKVLIVDDDDNVLEITKMCLKNIARWDVYTARSGRGALEVAAHERPALILLDVMMPDLDGPATLRLLRDAAATKEIPVIFLTGNDQQGEQEYLNSLGTLGLIAKPFNPLRLSGEITELLRQNPLVSAQGSS